MRRLSLTKPLLAAAALLGVPTLAPAQDFVRQSIPYTWMDEYVPEKLPALKYPAYFTELDKARLQAFRGRYKTALITLQKVTQGDPAEIALVKAHALASIGRRNEAIEVLSNPALAANVRVQAEKAKVLGETGKLPESIAQLKALIEKNPDSLIAHFYLGAMAERAGDLEAARDAYGWIHNTYFQQWQGLGAKQFEDAEQVTLMGRAFDRYAMLTGAYANNTELHNLILKVFVQAYDIIDRDYWPAHLASAEYFMSHANPKEAEKELEAALSGNPNDFRAHVLLGTISLDSWNFDAADESIAAMRDVDRGSVEADILEARSLLLQRRPVDAESPANRVLAKQPNSIEALGLLATSYSLQLREQECNDLLKKIEATDPDNATAYLDIADQLSAMRQYPRAEQMYEIAIDRAPWWMAPRNGLGLLLTQSGDEGKAKEVLEAAYSLDPFNFRTTNYIILLEKLAKMAKRETEHFVVFYDEQKDPLLGEYINEYLESIHGDIAGAFKHEPKVKTYIEIFSTHDAFSVRTTGSPFIGTVGASTGRVIALVTPRKGERTMGPFNWSQVLRHEYTHTVTLSATDNRIGHWMTEGLAVYQEHSPIKWEWVPMLYRAVTKKELFSMDDITWAFVRPKRPQDRSLAYAQSYWICKYIEEKWGHDSILKMMEQFKQGRTQEQVFFGVLKISTSAFTDEFFVWTERQIEGWGYDPETTKQYNALVKAAEEQVKAGDYKEAIGSWEEIRKIRPMDQLPYQRLAGLYLSRQTKDSQKAFECLVRLHDVSLKDNRFAKRIARLCMNELADPQKAETYATEAVYIDPYDLDAHELLLQVHEKTGNKPGLEREQRVIPVLKQWLAEYRKSTLFEGAPQP
jgi:cellulose synthase operon protein C